VEGRAWTQAALARLGDVDDQLAAKLELAAGFIEWPRSQAAARRHWERAVESFRRLDHPRYVAYGLALHAGTYIGDLDNYSFALESCDEAIALARRVCEHPLLAQAVNVKGELARVAGDDELALAAYEEGMAEAVAAGDQAHQSVFLANLSYLADHRGAYEEALELGRDALRLCWSLGRRMMAAWTVSEIAGPELGLGRPERGAILVGAADEALRVLGATRHPGDRPEHDRVTAGLRSALGESELERLRSEGRTMSLDAAVAFALTDPRTG
jgi:tetratricopeptide (TPR) repeat protein